MSKLQGLREIYQVTERRDGCVYKTKKLYKAWVDLDLRDTEDMILASISTSDPDSSKGPRRVTDDTPSIVRVN